MSAIFITQYRVAKVKHVLSGQKKPLSLRKRFLSFKLVVVVYFSHIFLRVFKALGHISSNIDL